MIALQHGATIDKFIGDAMLLFFGDPQSKGVAEDAKACVVMAIAMQRRMRDLEQEWRNRGLLRPFRIRMGITTGFCTVGNFGSRDRMDYTIIGNEVNLAARLQSATEPGSILLSHETNALVQGLVMTEEQPPITVKGFPKPISGYKIVGTFDDLIKEGRVVLEERDGLHVLVDLTKQDSSDVIEILEGILTRLKLPRGKGKKGARGGQSSEEGCPARLSWQTAGGGTLLCALISMRQIVHYELNADVAVTERSPLCARSRSGVVDDQQIQPFSVQTTLPRFCPPVVQLQS